MKVSNNYDVGLASYIITQFGIEIPSSKPSMLVTNILGGKAQATQEKMQSVKKLLHHLVLEIIQTILENIRLEFIM